MARHRDPATGQFAVGEPAVNGRPVALAVERGARPGTGPHDGDAMEPDADLDTGTTDFGALRVPLPAGGAVMVEPPGAGGTHALHVTLPAGRLSVSALAAPKSSRLWPELAKEIEASLREGGARVRSFTGDWGRELHATTGAATSVFVGVDGPRWMLYGVATGPTATLVSLDEELRRMLRGTVVLRGASPYPVRTVLPLSLPAHLAPPEEPEPAPPSNGGPSNVETPGSPAPTGQAGGGAPGGRSGATGGPDPLGAAPPASPQPVSPPAATHSTPRVPAVAQAPASPWRPSRHPGAPPVAGTGEPRRNAPTVGGRPPVRPAGPTPPVGPEPRFGAAGPADPELVVTDRLPVVPAVRRGGFFEEAPTRPLGIVPPGTGRTEAGLGAAESGRVDSGRDELLGRVEPSPGGAGSGEPSFGAPRPVEPGPVESGGKAGYGDSGRAESGWGETGSGELGRLEPGRFEPGYGESGRTLSGPVEPARGEPAGAEPVARHPWDAEAPLDEPSWFDRSADRPTPSRPAPPPDRIVSPEHPSDRPGSLGIEPPARSAPSAPPEHMPWSESAAIGESDTSSPSPSLAGAPPRPESPDQVSTPVTAPGSGWPYIASPVDEPDARSAEAERSADAESPDNGPTEDLGWPYSAADVPRRSDRADHRGVTGWPDLPAGNSADQAERPVPRRRRRAAPPSPTGPRHAAPTPPGSSADEPDRRPERAERDRPRSAGSPSHGTRSSAARPDDSRPYEPERHEHQLNGPAREESHPREPSFGDPLLGGLVEFQSGDPQTAGSASVNGAADPATEPPASGAFRTSSSEWPAPATSYSTPSNGAGLRDVDDSDRHGEHPEEPRAIGHRRIPRLPGPRPSPERDENWAAPKPGSRPSDRRPATDSDGAARRRTPAGEPPPRVNSRGGAGRHAAPNPGEARPAVDPHGLRDTAPPLDAAPPPAADPSGPRTSDPIGPGTDDAPRSTGRHRRPS